MNKATINPKAITITLTTFAKHFLYFGHCFIINYLYYLILVATFTTHLYFTIRINE